LLTIAITREYWESLSRRFYVCFASSLEKQWNAIKKDLHATNSDLVQKMIIIEKSEAKQANAGFRLVRAFFLSLGVGRGSKR
jgi:hypothetical protein